ncbi:hypothetical protein J4457_06150 [Candidatus Woesearchaeota archaeon]|nr:hypothetical protein [Candidatus Woesearchaeota archaeon]
MAKKRRAKKGSATYIQDLERDVCEHELHQKCLRCGAMEFTIGLITGVIVAVLLTYAL